MKRDMDLVRHILEGIEGHSFSMRGVELQPEGYSPEEVTNHVLLLHEAGLLRAIDFSDHSGPDWRPTRLTWDGHEFLEAARDETRWARAKEIMQDKAGGMSFEVLKAVLTSLAKDAVFG